MFGFVNLGLAPQALCCHCFAGYLLGVFTEITFENAELPDALNVTLYPDNHQITPPYMNERVEAASFKVNKPLEKGTYRYKVEAFNKSDKKLSETPDDIKFTIN